MSRKSLGERILALCVEAPSGCWEWTGYRDRNGYGQLRVGSSTMQAYRASYMVFKGVDLSSELVVDHLCRNHGCVNPMHLDAVSNWTNQARGMTKTARGLNRTQCRRGHPWIEENIVQRGNGYYRCRLCHAQDEKARRARRKIPTESVKEVAHG